jgi:hypothetical protein
MNEINNQTNIEFQKLRIEEDRLQFEIQFRQKELDAQLKREKFNSFLKVGTILVTLIASGIAIFGSLLNLKTQDYNALRLERQKFEAELIKNATSTDDPQQRIANLRFLIDVGLLSNTLINLKLAEHPNDIPSFKQTNTSSASIPDDQILITCDNYNKPEICSYELIGFEVGITNHLESIQFSKLIAEYIENIRKENHNEIIQINIEGFADSLPIIPNHKYPSNYELAQIRAESIKYEIKKLLQGQKMIEFNVLASPLKTYGFGPKARKVRVTIKVIKNKAS